MHFRPKNAFFSAICVLLTTLGCANPGNPKPPTLHLPKQVSDLSAQRLGTEVELRFTAPTRTTDNDPIGAGTHADICRSIAGSHCEIILSQIISPGINTFHDKLPQELISGQPGLLSYRVQLSNPAGRTAGWSHPVYTASGSTPDPIDSPQVTVRDRGIQLSWTSSSSEVSSIHLSRQERGPEHAPEHASQKQAAPVQLQASAGTHDPGGLIDATAQLGHSYLYELRRVRQVQIDSHTIDISSALTRLDTGPLRDTTPPAAPTSLVASSGTDGISLSWMPNTEADLAGYILYRRDTAGSEWRRLNQQPGMAPQYTDQTAHSGNSYIYTVTAIDTSGNEGPRSAEITQDLR